MALLTLLVLTIAREPLLVTAPRLWAEEGAVYLATALAQPFGQSFPQGHLGYYALFPNAVAELAAALPLELAPTVTTFASLLVQMALLAMILALPAAWLPGFGARFLVAAGLVILSSPEGWLNTINSQFWLAAGTFWLLGARPETRLARTLALIWLTVAMLTGVVSLFFAPFFVLRAWSERKAWLVAAAVACFAALAIQLAVLLPYLADQPADRFHLASPALIFEAVMRNSFRGLFILVGFGLPVATVLIVSMTLSFLYVLAGVRHLIGTAPDQRRSALLFGVLPVTVYVLLAVAGSVEMIGGGRYALPATLALFGGMVAMTWGRRPLIAALPLLLLLLHLPAWLDMSGHYSPEWPAWRPQIAAHAGEERFEVAIFPQGPKRAWSMVVTRPAAY